MACIFQLITESSVNLADDDLLFEGMRDAGFRSVFLGIETPVEESLKEAQKSQNRGNLLDSVERSKVMVRNTSRNGGSAQRAA